ncbi:ribosomal protein large subunit L16 [Thermoplasma volcanium GSS1]|uniref:Large ribosomal subunit protein uL13 n=1 Tax=Thermoplasma volcanium (strain ATCC 51530 / DSM 4299 / JCM 9571 / NBRC 15438 / GSS1) TaxID=273116 RepID=RL13_THEVO|nr:50S ribosomal protein L13 [Thermoplasma volcanium]Q979K2.1 RecName: Full=Large ribosomal subunit protein uL13; AltName: Full=50S ribosomal protein L13 [Thermoplasma volcanium GSS1]BAB60301.1 ribosomal protein large subunit L16 [Thermoplasma volcanium GSS1]
MKIIDASNTVYGRLSAYVAKQLLNGEEVVIVNASKAVITGDRKFIIDKFKQRLDIGSVRKGPYYPKTPENILRRSIGDMLPKKITRGKEALSRCKVYRNLPKNVSSEKIEKVDDVMTDKVVGIITLEELSKELGGM